MVALIVSLPAVVPVKVTVYVPLPWSVTALKVPPAPPVPRLKTTVNPPLSSWRPSASRAVNVTAVVPFRQHAGNEIPTRSQSHRIIKGLALWRG